MKSTVIWSLVGLNLLLAAVVIARAMPMSSAHAQVAGRRPSDYLMIPGTTVGLSYSVVYVLDTTNGSLGAMGYDDSRKRMETMPSIDLNRVFGNAGGAANPGGVGAVKGGYK